ncbi:DUF1129 family protein [Virgibacillus sp. W0181]|uniref:DUF1129 family protein n=1 Tax=Virgibacillus sp. W0181 TaxID=3391581 RepID=UPI003F4545D3
MDKKYLIQENNEKRKHLSKENRDYYEEMLVYIRLSFSKSEQSMEEILSEMIDHLLEAQAEGKTAEEVFGNDPKQYANEIIGELPKMVTKERTGLFVMGILYFLAASIFFRGVFDIVIYYIFGKGDLTKTVYVGSSSVMMLLSIPIAFIFLYAIIYYLRWACFKKINKILEFFILWLYSMVSLGIFVFIIYFTPDFGPVLNISSYVMLLFGLLLYVAGRITRKAI